MTVSAATPTRRPTVVVCFGTRPEAIKLAPVVEALRASAAVDVITVATGQHRELLDQATHVLGITQDVDLAVMRPRQSLAELTARALEGLGAELARIRPSAIVVQGDTTTALCGAMAGFYAHVPVGHVEAGMRTGDLTAPFPEEANRRMVSLLARWHWAATERSAQALRAEGVAPHRIHVTGNTVVDALTRIVARAADAAEAGAIPPRTRDRRLLVTLHRRETQGPLQEAMFAMLARLARRPDLEIVFPIHRSPSVSDAAHRALDGVEGVHQLPPLDYVDFVALMRGCDLILTDSGGVQEEAPTFGIPTLVARETTERVEALEAGCVRLSGTDAAAIEQQITQLLDDDRAYAVMARAASPYGDGHAAQRIVDTLLADLLVAA